MGDNLPTTYPDPVQIAVIGGTGLRDLPNLQPVAKLTVATPWGLPSSPIHILHHTPPADGTQQQQHQRPVPIAFLARHGPAHSLAPHEVPSRANIAALRSLGVRCILAFSAVGSLQESIAPRDFVAPAQILDRTKGVRPWTFFEGGVVAHAGFADPFCESLRGVVVAAAHAGGVGDGAAFHDDGTLVVIEGPQFSTRAESAAHRAAGGAVVNMSGLPEAKLAREAELAYAVVCMATDYDCWRGAQGEDDVSVDMVMGHMRANAGNARRLVAAVLDALARPENAAVVRGERWVGSMTANAGMTAPEARAPDAVAKLQWLFPGCF